jgi:TolB-like protein
MRIAVLALLLTFPAAALAAGRTKVAVTEIRNVQGVAVGTATILTDIVVSEVSKAGYDVLSQADISAMVGFEKQKRMLGCEETGCLAELGGALGVDFLLTGQVGQIGTRYRISLLVVDAKKSRVVARAAQFCDQNEDALARVAEQTVAQVLAPVRGDFQPGPPAAAPRPRPDLAAAPPRPPAAPVITGPRHLTRGAWISAGAGAALLAGGLVTGLAAQSRLSSLKAKQGQAGYYDLFPAEEKRVKSMALTSDVLSGLGVASLGVAGWLYYRSDTAVAFAPVPTPGGLALVAQGRF